MPRSITAIVVNYFTAHFLPSLLSTLENEPLIGSVIVADNSREVGLHDIVRPYGKVSVLVHEENTGFGAAVNRAAAITPGNYWLVLNPDLHILPGAIPALWKAAEETGAVLTGPRYFWDEEKIFRFPPATGYSHWLHQGDETASRFALDSELVSFSAETLFDRYWRAKEPFAEPFLNGACLLIRNDPDLIPDLKIFDERFFMYFEDTDLCARLLLRGVYPVCAPAASVIHYWNQSPSEQKPRLMWDSERQFIQKHYDETAPVWNNAGYEPAGITNFGIVSDPPLFSLPESQPARNLVIDFGVNHYFRPFARAEFNENMFVFPQAIWDRLSSGVFFTRIYEPGFCKTLSIWQWKKG
jgi:GT2 family glycosyltransferase